MSPRSMLEEIARAYPVIIRTEYHAQIRVTQNGYHDIWICNNRGGLKIRFHGNPNILHTYKLKLILEKLERYNYNITDLAKTRELEGLIIKAKRSVKSGVFCDAGFKDGKGRIGIVRLTEFGTDVHTRDIEIENSFKAELEALKLAEKLYPGDRIYSDCLDAVNALNHQFNNDRFIWIRRTQNGQADYFSNLRKHDD